ncbi:putative katanin p60 atpase-containing subunit protein [Phaeoacremonium minimum UCRPA7]|uniref:Putative katanin p60 atpase-containing subunit protein n=1 Tax=Phaeoacremonium minimum (strain UCR-PA7) TaxID=1286976 RepID=R8BY86_PHAM7|nr:putative katanin p60 atpase-containing subunit protein [Phaeoacremonium minimum UCRPA7]EOO04323.1 putative katanin p60 atpase-containing subunit protein [Phaeoacremonium minimum UCRPA7]
MSQLEQRKELDIESRNSNIVQLAEYYISALSKESSSAGNVRQVSPEEPQIATSYHTLEAKLSHSLTDQGIARDHSSISPVNAVVGEPSKDAFICQELLSTLRAELSAKALPAKAIKEPKRPVSVLSVLNYRGPSVAAHLVDAAALELGAWVVRLDAAVIGRLVGQYLGQSPYSSRGGISMLGYAAADANGRLVSKTESTELGQDQDLQTISVTKLFPALADDRWEELKMSRILEEILCAPDVKTAMSTRSSDLTLIVHIHDYVELVMTPEGASIINKLRTVIDRKWQKGAKIVMLGSTSSHINSAPKWRETLDDLRKDDCHIVPFYIAEQQASAARRLLWEQCDYLRDNINNITSMLEAMTGKSVSLDLERTDDVELRELQEFLGRGLYDIHWIYRFATQILGSERFHPHGFEKAVILGAFQTMSLSDGHWTSMHATAEHGHFSTFISPGGTDLDANVTRGTKRQRRQIDTSNFDEYEKKLLSGLVDAEDINVTFKDVVAPPEVGESLLTLTSLSLHRPEAFSYGVLARERIHGCLLYGPPGTGKTMMAKALAKQSEANMLEVSAASINDMWVGNSEKNVRALFAVARKLSPMVIFLDEAEALLGTRSTKTSRGGFHEALNQFLREWDGLTTSLNDSKTFIVVATNRPFDLDEAVLRRLPRRILVDLPLRSARLDIMQSLLRDEILDPSVSLDRLATETELYSGSDLKNLCVAAAMDAVKEELRAKDSHQGSEEFKFADRRVLTNRHFQKALSDISASISEDMESLKAIRKFDERYGDSGRRQKKRNLMGFDVVPNQSTSEDARVRRL